MEKFGKLTLHIKKLFCPKCKHDFSKDHQIGYDLYLSMVAQSKEQKEPQLRDYVDIYRKGFVCSRCGESSIIAYKFIKMRNLVILKQLTEEDFQTLACRGN